MDKRRGLPAGTLLSFPGMTCEIVAESGRGSNAIVYLGRYSDALNAGQWHNVLIKELFPYHDSGAIYRSETGSTVCHTDEGSELMELHRRSFIWGNEAHLRLRAANPAEVSGNINTFPYNGTYYTILDFNGGRTLAAELNRSDEQVTLRRMIQRIIGVLDSLSIFHNMGFLHLDISPDNILLIGRGSQERVELIDYNSIVPISALNAGQTPRLSIKPGYASPEARAHDTRLIGTWTDLYSVVAVLFNCLMGRPLSNMESSGVRRPDVSESRYLSDAPETVRSLLRQIVAHGLAPTVRRRYQTAAELRADLCELLDRIDGVGVTHWALWEVARKCIHREVKLNPAADYLTDESRLYPLELDKPAGSGFEALLMGRAVLTGSGGAGKTTLLMRTAWLESLHYRRDRPAVIYLSLYGYHPGDPGFIRDSLLRRMKFKADTSSYADARHALELLLQKPLRTRSGTAPALCLLLDGYNEISGDTHSLRQEISQLAQLDGVSMLIASRTALREYPFEHWQLRPLAESTVRATLSAAGLLMPESPQLLELLANSMMLSLYVRACLDSHEQVQISTREELIRAYLRALLAKELAALPPDAPQRWQIDAAIKCVYPMIADMEVQRGRSVAGKELLHRMEQLYHSLNRRALLKRYPQWIGHAADIRGSTRDSDEWYGLMIHDLLWRRLGLLYQDAYGEYRVAHQEFRDVLSGSGRALRPLFMRSHRLGLMAIGGVCMALAVCLCILQLGITRSYDVNGALDALSYVQATYMGMNNQYATMLSLLGNAQPDQSGFDPNTSSLTYSFDDARRALDSNVAIVALDLNADGHVASECAGFISDKLSVGEHFPWNELAFDVERFDDMTAHFDECSERYATYIDLLEFTYLRADDYARCRELIRAVLDANARVAAAYNCLLLTRRLDGLPAWETTAAGAAAQGAYQRLDDGRKYCSQTNAFIQSDWLELSLEQLASELTDALDAEYAARTALSKDPAYADYLAATLTA